MGQKELCAVFARNLERLMNNAGLKQSDIAVQLKVSKAQVSDWCAGKNIPRSNNLGALADLFGCNLSDLVSDKKPAPEDEGGLNEDEKAVIAALRQLTPEEREKVSAMIKAYVNS